MSKYYRILSMLLVLASLFTLYSCNEATPLGGTSATTATTVTPATTTTTAPPETPPSPPSPPPVKMLPSQEVTILDQNVLCSGSQDGSTLEQRLPATSQYMLELLPDSIGVQEAKTAWADHLDAALGEKYARVGVECNKGEDKGGFATYVYYRKDKYKVIATDTFWLSTTPDVPSQEGSVKDANRTCTWVILEDKETGFRYVHMNCHADHKDGIINAMQLQMIRSMMLRFEAMGYPVFATGDYNTREGSFSYEQMVADGKITDARYATSATDSTVSHFGNNANIDYCFITGNTIDVKLFDVIENKHGDVTVSDHNGIYVRAKVHSLPEQDGSLALPSFAEGTKPLIKESSVSRSQMEMTLLQARNELGMVAKSYEIQVHDKMGYQVFETTVVGSFCLPYQPRKITATLSGGIAGQTYQLTVTPISILGERGEALVTKILWLGEQIIPTKPNAADIVDIWTLEGKAIDISPNEYVISQIGNVTVTDEAMIFNKGGNLRTPNISSQYEKMSDGFSMEMLITTGKDVTSSQNYLSNNHAGGFSFGVANGKLQFNVHNGKDYVVTSVKIEAEKSYHVVGVYDGTNLFLYLNGVMVSSAELGGSMKFATEDGAKYLCIGADSDKSGKGEYHAECTIYHAAIYSQVLTDGEVLHLYQDN